MELHIQKAEDIGIQAHMTIIIKVWRTLEIKSQ